ncbi:ABC transporter ATP-binding protein [Paenibacillus sp. CGMCC 1.16610]|uniref:ATP-binding cassette domain-containing protein n=1 Tax=Paenibacillus anseongense TaxID=2682845 RepID=A0ABW9U2E5_9BACL|nr:MULTISPECIES: ABC transporter ATP-binding protein [Paenibacillus]MBA2941724.1 ABC transporter ATP-binding protein [Paenibacillus sp. CGMCC 1.16610]MVQ34242.1 ATP-binding cassette domain-containing protein [Paenibacillus anseongense]
MWKLRSFVKPYWLITLLAPLLMVMEVCMDLTQPRLMAAIVNHGVAEGNLALVWSTGLHMLGVAFLGLIGGVGCTFFTVKAAQNFGADLRLSVFEKVQSFSFRQLDTFSTGSLITRLTGDVMQMLNILQILLRQFTREASLLIGSIIMAIVISPRLSLILLAVVPIQFLILFVLMRRSTPLFRLMQARLDRVNTVMQESTSGIRVIKAFVRAAFERTRFGKANTALLDASLSSARALATSGPLMTLILNISIVAVLWFGGGQTWSGSMAIGDLAAFIIYITQVLFSLVSISNTLMNISRAQVSAERIREVLDTEPDMNEPVQERSEVHTERNSLVAGCELEFDQVSFVYDSAPNQPVLENISFKALPGQTIGILGATGSGKSTLVSLIPRLYDATKGRILLGGVDIKEMPVEQLRSQIGIVLQQSILFSGTIRENLLFGRPGATAAEIEEAAKAAEADGFIRQLPEGYEAKLGQRGVNLSGGQKQRIAIARALLLRSPLLVLDDSTSAIDLGTEKRIQRSLQQLMAGSTRIIIAQRVTSVLHADQILVLDEGRIAARGTHEELLATSAIYQDIYLSQQGKETALHG